MRRLHLFEWEDQPWFPALIRNYMTDYLRFATEKFDFYELSLPTIKKGLQKSGGSVIVDLASGGGGGLLKIAQNVKPDFPDLKILLTDYYPNVAAFREMVRRMPDVFVAHERSVDALHVPSGLNGFRTQFLSFHHFRPSDARRILQNAVDGNAVIGIFEAQKRDIKHLLQFAMSVVAVLLLTPFIRPLKLGRLFFTYLLPILPILVAWDGVVSVLRTYSDEELRAMIAGVRDEDTYTWEIGENSRPHMTGRYLLAYPRDT